MTNKEAIRVLKSTSINFSRMGGKTAYVEALEMAITALQVQDKLQDIEYMCRLSGGADYFNAFRAISEKVKNTTTFLNNLNDGVENSTATQSNGIESKVKGMTACRVPEVAKDTNVLNNDTISRQAAIDTLKMDISIIPFAKAREYVRVAIETIYNRLEELPSVQPKQCDFEKQLHDMFDHIWYCKIDHPVFQDTVGDLMRAVIEAHYRVQRSEIIRCRDCRWRKDQSGSTAWLPCRAMATPSDFYCSRAERRIDDRE